MNETKFDLEQIRNSYTLSTFLHKIGHDPKRHSGGEYFYHSMLREGDRTPSFCVNDKLGLWYDHGIGKGGTIIDLGKELWPRMDFKEVIAKLLTTMGDATSERSNNASRPVQLEIPLRHPSYLIHEDRPLGGNKQIKAYLESRGIYDINSPLRELYYSIKPEGKNKMSFAAAGWQNVLGGWEVRSNGFKGCLGRKGMNIISGSLNKVCLFEGMMDYLSWKTQMNDQSSAVILNSLSLLPSGVSLAKDFPIIDIYFDHDTAGEKATLRVKEQLPWAVDQSGIYAGYNDFNEQHQNFFEFKKSHAEKLDVSQTSPPIDHIKYFTR